MARLPHHYFERRSDALSVVCVGSHIALVFAPVFASAFAGPQWWWVLAWVFVGFGMNGLLNLMHESAHALVFRNKRPSEFLGRHVLAPLVFADFDGYKARHWQHHRCLGVEGETKDTYLIDIRGARILRLFVRCLCGIEALGKFTGQSTALVESQGQDVRRHWLVRVAVTQGILISALLLTALGGQRSLAEAVLSAAAAYGFVYLYALMSLTIFAAALRAIAEHQLHGESDVQGYAALRNFKCNFITRFLMGAYGFGEHETHHMHPGIPDYHLPAATARLAVEQTSLIPKSGYFTTLFRIIQTDDRRQTGRPNVRVRESSS